MLYVICFKDNSFEVCGYGDFKREWADIIYGMQELANFTVSDFCLRHAPEGQPKFDIADYVQQQRQ